MSLPRVVALMVLLGCAARAPIGADPGPDGGERAWKVDVDPAFRDAWHADAVTVAGMRWVFHHAPGTLESKQRDRLQRHLSEARKSSARGPGFDTVRRCA